MPIFSKENKNVLFIHIPKSAGSTIEKIGADLGWSESFSVRGRSLEEIRFYKASLQHLHAKPLECLLDLEGFDSVFTIVRNPFSRLKSEYYWQLSQGITSLSVDDWVYDVFKRYSKNNYVYDNHIRPQVEFVPASVQAQVFKLEESAIESARSIFLSHSAGARGIKSRAKKLTSVFSLGAREKQSVKDPEVEARFKLHYERIVEFYKKDYSEFSYKI
ncbi:sulfotransferase family 2 domain-containing protein [Chromohalobacter sp. 48-RD10]|uniref:sulfotransferase family 2 domain-containing protein n=1 Tax=Chromohalobacter sp. 48-RD10 TaxID=2994063 RepID=UPI002468E315|nr:sulfotransferase family 2 domain-containing protein [Chromohalobacter sp. 48-RD10]